MAMIGISVMELATNKLMPIGGVTKPMAKFTIIMTPKCRGDTPTAVTIGRRIGVRMRMAGVVSMTMPTKSRKIFTAMRSSTAL